MINIGIIGNGFVGSAVAQGFSLWAIVRVYDVEPHRSTHSLDEVARLYERFRYQSMYRFSCSN